MIAIMQMPDSFLVEEAKVNMIILTISLIKILTMGLDTWVQENTTS